MARYVTLALHLVEQTEENLDLLKKAHILGYEGEDAEEAEKLRDTAWDTYNQAYTLLNTWLDEAYTEKYSQEPDYTPLQGVMDGYYTGWTTLQPNYSTWDLTTPKKHELDAELLLAVDRLRREGVISGYSITSSS
jgi:hypothetical protein